MLAATVAESARRHTDRPALVAAAGWSLSYRDLDRLSGEVAGAMAGAGVSEGDVVALVLPSTPEYVVAYAAAARLGAVTAGVNPRLAGSEQRALVASVDPDLVLTTGDLDPAADAPTRVVEPARAVAGVLAGLRDGSQVETVPVDRSADRDVAIVFTSGTTGRPKGAAFTERQLEAIVEIDTGGAWGGGGPILASTQFAHVGFMTKLPWYLRMGCTLHLLDRWTADGALSTIASTAMTSVGGVAPQMSLMLRSPRFDSFDLSAVQTIVMGGAASPPGLVREARERFGAAYSIRYSSTESGGVGCGTAFDADDEEAMHTVGRPRSGVEVRIDGGEVLMRSAATMDRYWNDPAATATALTAEGWLRTGDLGEFDDQGCLRLLGRADDVYIRGGYNVHPAEVEAVLRGHPGVADVAVVPRPDDVMGEVGVAMVVAADPSDPPTLTSLLASCEGTIAGFKHPVDVVVVDDLPMTAMHKLDRRALADVAAQVDPDSDRLRDGAGGG